MPPESDPGLVVLRAGSSENHPELKKGCHKLTTVSYCDHAYGDGLRAVGMQMPGMLACMDGGR